MIVNRRIVDDFLLGKDISGEWIFSQIEEGKYLFCLSDIQTKQEDVKGIADRIAQMTAQFEPCNAAYYRSLFPEFEKGLDDYEVMLTVGVPAPYDAMVREHDGRERIVFDMGRFLAYPNPEEFARLMLTHETTHALLHQRWNPKQATNYREQLRFVCFDEGFAHLLACGKELSSFDASSWIKEHEKPALEQLRLALACEDDSKQKEWLMRADAGAYWDKFAAIAGKLYLINHLDSLKEIYEAGPNHFLPHIFDTSERKESWHFL